MGSKNNEKPAQTIALGAWESRAGKIPHPAVVPPASYNNNLELVIRSCVGLLPRKRRKKTEQLAVIAGRMTIEDEKNHIWRKFTVSRCSASVDSTPTKVRENSSTLNYITPHFRADAEVELGTLKEGEIYTIGWVQAVTDMKFHNTYPSGQSSWEIPELNSGESEAVSDADGRQYPWYGVTSECKTVTGPHKPHSVRVCMNDNFSPTVSWAIPVGKDQPDTLQRVQRDQSFTAWLVIKNEIDGKVQALKAYRWRAVIDIVVDCSQCVGQRAKLLEPVIQEQPEDLQELRIPSSALGSPRANEAQKFVWRTLDSELIFEVSCTPALPPILQPTAVSEVRYASRYQPY